TKFDAVPEGWGDQQNPVQRRLAPHALGDAIMSPSNRHMSRVERDAKPRKQTTATRSTRHIFRTHPLAIALGGRSFSSDVNAAAKWALAPEDSDTVCLR